MDYVQPQQCKALTETFWMIWLIIGLSWKITKIRTTLLFFKIDPCWATSMERSRRDLSNDMAEHRSILKIKENTAVSVSKTQNRWEILKGCVRNHNRCYVLTVLPIFSLKKIKKCNNRILIFFLYRTVLYPPVSVTRSFQIRHLSADGARVLRHTY